MVQYFLAQHAPQDRLQPYDDMSSSSQRAAATASTQQEENSESHNSELSSEGEEEVPKEDPPASPSSPSEEDTPAPFLPWHQGGEEETANSRWNGAADPRASGTRPRRGTLRKTFTGLPRDQTLLGKAKPLPPQNSLRRKRVYTCTRCHSADIECIRDQRNSSKRRKLDGGGTERKCRTCGSHKIDKKRSETQRATVPIKQEFVATVNSSSIESDVECLEQTKAKIKLEACKSKAPNLNGSVVVRSPSRDDSIDHFGKYVTSLLRLVPAKRALRLQKEVISLVLEDQMRSSDCSD